MTETVAYTYLLQLVNFTGSILTTNFIFGFSVFQFFFFCSTLTLLLKIITGGKK